MFSKINNGVLEHFDERDDVNEVLKKVKEIGKDAFSGSSIEEITIPQSVTSIEIEAFYDCENLKSVTFEEGSKLEEIGESAFLGSGIEKITIPSSVTSVGDWAFSSCTSLKKVTFEEGSKLEKIGEYAFRKSGIEEITIPKSVTSIGVCAFIHCKNLKNVTFEEGSKLEKIGEDAFRKSGIEEITIPSSVTSVGNGAFVCCELNKINVKKGNTKYHIDGNCLIETSSKNLIAGFKNSIIPTDGSVTSIGDVAFSGSSIEEITIPSSVKSIGYGAFYACENLKSVTFEEGSKLEKIGEDAFSESSIEEITIPSSVKSIGSGTFERKIILNFQSRKIPYGLYEKINIDKRDEIIANFSNKEFEKFMKKFSIEGLDDETLGFITFAYDIGCFSENSKLKQRAVNWLEEQVKSGELDPKLEQFTSWKINGENEEFSNFLFGKDNNDGIRNFKKIKEEPEFDKFLYRIYMEYTNLNQMGGYGLIRDEKCKLKFRKVAETQNLEGIIRQVSKTNVPTVELFKMYFVNSKFWGIEDEEQRSIANELNKHIGMEQDSFDTAKIIIKKYNELKKEGKISSRIVEKHLLGNVENKINEYKKIIDETEKQAIETAEEVINTLKDIVDKDFTYDWLEKNDPMNFCLGLYCDCCATLKGVGYGIMHSNFINPDIQNLVIKDKQGNPVAKSTMYINRDEGYMVFNNIEVNDNIIEEDKKKIYKEYKEGVKAFILAYNSENPNKPIKKASVGLHLNDLEDEIKKDCKPSDILSGDDRLKGIDFGEYGISTNRYSGDWEKENQYILWQEDSQKGEVDEKEFI